MSVAVGHIVVKKLAPNELLSSFLNTFMVSNFNDCLFALLLLERQRHGIQKLNKRETFKKEPIVVQCMFQWQVEKEKQNSFKIFFEGAVSPQADLAFFCVCWFLIIFWAFI